MANYKNSLKQKLEHLFDMRTGYVLDFSNATFEDFIQTSIGVTVYDKYSGSKAQILRQLWQDLDDQTAITLTLEMLERWQTNSLIEKRPQLSDLKLYESAKQELEALQPAESAASASDLEFLNKDFGQVDLASVKAPAEFKTVIAERLQEIDQCLKAKAPLAVIFLCGSTLEGLLAEVADKQSAAFLGAQSAPKPKGVVKPLEAWTLFELITTGRELGVVGEDVSKHAHAVRDFRNYIHPRRQIRENFSPRMITAEIAHKVLQAAISDLSAI